MTAKRKIFAAILALILILSSAGNAFAAENDTSAIVQQMINYYRYHQDAAATDIARLSAKLAEIDPEQANIWKQIMDYWSWVNREMTVNSNILPDCLPEDDSLCIVVLGYALNRDGSMQKELIGRLEVALASAKKYPNAYILCTGGGTASGNSHVTEAGRMAAWLEEQGIDENRIIIENNSLTTVQNAQYSCRILSDQYPQVRHLSLITSDYHLARGHVLFYAQSQLSGCGYDIVGNACFQTGYKGSESIQQQALDLAQMNGMYISSMKEPSLSQLTGITVECAPTYEMGGTLELTVTANYDSGFSRDVTGLSFISGFPPEQTGMQSVTLAYTENGIKASASAEFEVLPHPTEAVTEPPPPTEPTENPAPEPVSETKSFSILYPLALMVILIILLVIIIRKKKCK